jgi:GDP-L-fucose synthase
MRINTNVINFAHKYDTQKVLSFLSTCVYPDKANYPLTEDQIQNGPPHSSNYAYAYAKRMLDVQSRAYRKQFGRNYITVIPNNIMGIHDNFDLNDSHVLPAIIRKVYEAKLNKTPVTMWGDGNSLREFTFSDDMAKLILFMFEKYNGEYPVNIGNNEEYSIKAIVEKVVNILEFEGKIIWDKSKPAGQYRKPSSTEKFKQIYGGEFKFTPIDDALKAIQMLGEL